MENTTNLRRTARRYKKVNYAGMDTIEPECEYDFITNVWHDETIETDPDWLPVKELAKPATDKPATSFEDHPIYRFIKNYIAIFQDVKAKYQPLNYHSKEMGKSYHIDMMRVVIELYSAINDNRDIIHIKAPPLAKAINQKANQLIMQLEGTDEFYALKGHDLALYNNCMLELKNYIKSFQKYSLNLIE